jgi:aspartate/tyrosine/aromatic aminotransferase
LIYLDSIRIQPMFEHVQPAPPDAILGLNEAFMKDENPDKINLSVGVFKNDSGQTPILNCVKAAEQKLVETEATKNYLGIDGLPEFRLQVPPLLLGKKHAAIEESRVACLQTPGGTGGLRVAADLVATLFPSSKIWCSQPTWPNHPKVFAAAGLQVETYPYLDAAANQLDFDAMVAKLETIPAGDVVCLHASCHNPSGVDPTPEQWQTIASLMAQRGLLPLVDCAYQGFGVGLEEDVFGVRTLCESNQEVLISNSFSKNFGMYSERIGGLTIVAGQAEAAAAMSSQAKACIRANYSNPPKHGAAVVATVLGSEELYEQWTSELGEMRRRIHSVREQFVTQMSARVPESDFSFIAQQKGMFSFSGLTPMQVDRLRTEFSIYIVGSGRINVAGITSANIDRLCQSIAAVL